MPDNVRANLLQRRALPESDPNHLGDTEALYHAGQYEYHEKDNERQIQGYNLKEKMRTSNQDDLADTIGGVVKNGLSTFQHGLVVSAGVDTNDQLMEKMRDPNASDTDKLKWATDFQNNLDVLKKKLHSDVTPLLQGKGSTGLAEANKQINDATSFLEEQAKAMRDPANATSAVFASQHYLQAQKRDMDAIIWQQPEARKRAAAKALDDLNPNAKGNLISEMLGGEKDFTGRSKGMFESVVRATLGVPREDVKNNPPIISDYMSAAEKAGASPKAQMHIVNFVNDMNDRSMPDEKAYRIGKAFFDAKNQGMVGKWAMDAYNPTTGKTTQGQVNVFTQLGKVADKVQELSSNPKYADLKDDFMNFMNNTFKREVFPNLMD
jgi:hypothetical protein